jgi:homoserine O-acetyltransferase
MRMLVALTAIAITCIVQQAAAQSGQISGSATDYSAVSNQPQNDVSFADYKFRDGTTLPQLRIHYATLGNPLPLPRSFVVKRDQETAGFGLQ